MNKLMLVGRLCQDPESRMAGETPAAKFTIAVDRKYKDKEGNKVTDFIPCDALGSTANFITNYLSKGRLVAIEGEYRVDQYVDSEGNNRSFTKCFVDSIQALDSAKTAENNNNATPIAKPIGNKPVGNKKPSPLKKPGQTVNA